MKYSLLEQAVELGANSLYSTYNASIN